MQNDQVKDDEIGRACSMHGVKTNVYRILVEEPEGKRSLGRPKRKGRITLKRVLDGMCGCGLD
jgi:hypothetical protein